jgi:hypothetical protein
MLAVNVLIVKQNTYLGSIVTVDARTLQDVTAWVKKTNVIFVDLYLLWKNKDILMKLAIHILPCLESKDTSCVGK